MLEREAVIELQKLLIQEYDQYLSYEETKIIGLKLISLYKTILSKNKNENERLQTSTPK